MSIRVMDHVWKYSPHGGSELLALLGLGDFADDKGRSFPSINTLAKKIRLSPRMTKRVIKNLSELGAIEVQKNAGPHGCNVYHVALHPGPLVGVRSSPVTSCHRGQVVTGGRDVTGDNSDRGGDIFGEVEVTPATPEPSGTVTTEPSYTKGQKEREKHQDSLNTLPFSSDAFRAAWDEWKQHLREKKKPLGKSAAAKQLAKLAGMGEATAMAAISRSIENNWQSVFEPRAFGETAAPRQPREEW